MAISFAEWTKQKKAEEEKRTKPAANSNSGAKTQSTSSSTAKSSGNRTQSSQNSKPTFAERTAQRNAVDVAARSKTYQKKYAGKNYEEISSLLKDMAYGEERTWLEDNKLEVAKTAPDYKSRATSGWNRYLADQEAKQAEQDDETFFEKLGRWLSAGTPDTTTPLATTNQVIKNYREDTSYLRPANNWTEEQKETYGYLYGIDKNAASKYERQTTDTNNKPANEAQVKAIEEWSTKTSEQVRLLLLLLLLQCLWVWLIFLTRHLSTTREASCPRRAR